MVASRGDLDPWIRTGRPMNLAFRGIRCLGAAPSSLPCIPRPVLGAWCIGASLERPWALAPPNRQVHVSASPDPWIQAPSAGDHCSGPSDLQKKVGRCFLHLNLSVESDYGAPRGPRASPGRVSSSQRNVTNFMTQGSTKEIVDFGSSATILHRE